MTDDIKATLEKEIEEILWDLTIEYQDGDKTVTEYARQITDKVCEVLDVKE